MTIALKPKTYRIILNGQTHRTGLSAEDAIQAFISLRPVCNFITFRQPIDIEEEL
jgi:hypothetical protein